MSNSGRFFPNFCGLLRIFELYCKSQLNGPQFQRFKYSDDLLSTTLEIHYQKWHTKQLTLLSFWKCRTGPFFNARQWTDILSVTVVLVVFIFI